MIPFIHTADWQLGKPFAGVEDPQKRALVQTERLDAIRRIGDVVRQSQARFVIVAGDFFDSPTPTNATVANAFDAIKSLGVPVLAIPGNHDHGGPDSLWEQDFFLREHARLAPNFRVLLSREPVELDDAVLLPCPLLRRHEADDPTAWIRTLDTTRLGTKPRIVLAHGSTQNFTGESDDEEHASQANFIDLSRLPSADLDYIALGDWHGFVQAGPKAWFSGTHEIDRFPRADQQPGHVIFATAGRGVAPRVEAVRTGRLQWREQAVTLDDDDGPQRMNDILEQAILPGGPHETLVKLALHGSLSLAARKTLDEILESWRARLIRLRLEDAVHLTPSQQEIESLTDRPVDPIISRVAAELVPLLAAGGEEGAVARKALNLLHSLCR